MAVATSTVLATTAIVSSLVGAGMAFYGQQQQAQNAERVAAYNAAVQKQQAETNIAIARRQAEINQNAMAVQFQQADAINQQAAATERQANEQQRRQREEQQRLVAAQKAGYAKSGVVMEGTPIAMLAETVGIFELQNQDVNYEADMRSRSMQRQSQLTRYGLSNDAYTQKLNLAASEAAYRIGLDESRITKAQGAAAAQGYRTSSYGTLISGVGNAAGQTYQFGRSGAFKAS